MTRIDPTALYPRDELADALGCSPTTVVELERLFGLFPILGGGNTPHVFLGKTVLESLERRGRGRVCPARVKPLRRAETRRLMSAKD